jgi:hypothetical protein
MEWEPGTIEEIIFPANKYIIESVSFLTFPSRDKMGLLVRARRKEDGRYFEARAESEEIELVRAEAIDPEEIEVVTEPDEPDKAIMELP